MEFINSIKSILACADISVGKGTPSLIPTMKPSLRPSTKKPTAVYPPVSTTESTEISETEKPEQGQKPAGSNFMGALIAFFSFFLVVCGLATVYIYHYHGLSIKHFIRRQMGQDKQNLSDSHSESPSSTNSNSSINMPDEPPVRPPRTKHLSQNIRSIAAAESSILTGSLMNSEKNSQHSNFLPK